MFVVATGDGWGFIMNSSLLTNSLLETCLESPSYSDFVANGYQTIGCGNALATYFYFYSYYFIIVLIFLNLFVAIILDGY
mmetsp:Transcript_42176/g.40416  ORF Transcript_42176/g.40416 Transcript_42176/m.40416 type:complete len:80 (+) Transcript_42176:1676-1915(+)